MGTADPGSVEDDDNPYISDPDTDFPPLASISQATASEEIASLREAIRYHDYRYYVENDPVISDRTYDALFDRLQSLEDHFDQHDPNSPTQRVGGPPLDELGTVDHVVPLLSIDSSADEIDVRDFDDRVRNRLDEPVEYVTEPKFDGFSIAIFYEDGEYRRAATRGDGDTGEDVTENVRTIGSVPLELRGNPPGYLVVRGEVYMPRDAFQQYNKERIENGDDPFANPRNAAAGTIRQLNPSVAAERPLDCFFYEILAVGETRADALADADASRGGLGYDALQTHWDEHQTLPNWGFRVADRAERVDDIDAAIQYRHDLADQRDDLNYEIDGTVIKVNDRGHCVTLGTTSRHYRWSFGYKFPARSETTTIQDIVVQVGRTGRLTPVALLDPVDVSGVTVARASLHNQSEIEAMGTNVGDRVRVERAGDVIPYVAEVVESNSDTHFELPDTCPVCDSPVERLGPLHFCTGGLSCPAQLKRAVEHYASDDGLDIEGIGEETADELVDEGLIDDGLADLYTITETDLRNLEGWGETSAHNLIEELEASKHPPLDDFLSAIGIPEVGPAVAHDLATHFHTLDAVMTASRNELQSVDGVGEKMANQIATFFENDHNQRVIAALRDHGVDPEPIETETSAELDGVTFVFTGSVPDWTREELETLVERHGGNATSSVSGNTDYLVAGADPGNTKRDAADENDVPILSPEEFFTILEDAGVDVESPR